MIAKLVTYGIDRDEAITRMQVALDRYYIRGVQHNISFLNALMAHPRFREGRLTTNFIAEEYPEGFNEEHVPQEDPAKPIVVAAMIHRSYLDRAARISGQLHGYERQVQKEWAVICGGVTHQLTAKPTRTGYHVRYDGRDFSVTSNWVLGEPLFEGTINSEPVCFQVERNGAWYRLFRQGSRTDALVLTPRAAELHALMPEKQAPDLSRFLLSPMPGLLLKVSVEEGQEVKAGEELAVIEAMKMENVLRAAQDAVVAKVQARAGDSLMVDQAILEFE
jgi:propionyl-CoA carboxylase alpha chain